MHVLWLLRKFFCGSLVEQLSWRLGRAELCIMLTLPGLQNKTIGVAEADPKKLERKMFALLPLMLRCAEKNLEEKPRGPCQF